MPLRAHSETHFASPLFPLYQKHPWKSPAELFLASRNACPESLEPELGLQRCTQQGCCVLNWSRKIMGQARDSLAQMETYSWDSENQSRRITKKYVAVSIPTLER